MYKPLLMMRTKGLTGPLFGKHFGIKGLSKSVGNFAAGGSGPPISGNSPTYYGFRGNGVGAAVMASQIAFAQVGVSFTSTFTIDDLSADNMLYGRFPTAGSRAVVRPSGDIEVYYHSGTSPIVFVFPVGILEKVRYTVIVVRNRATAYTGCVVFDTNDQLIYADVVFSNTSISSSGYLTDIGRDSTRTVTFNGIMDRSSFYAGTGYNRIYMGTTGTGDDLPDISNSPPQVDATLVNLGTDEQKWVELPNGSVSEVIFTGYGQKAGENSLYHLTAMYGANLLGGSISLPWYLSTVSTSVTRYWQNHIETVGLGYNVFEHKVTFHRVGTVAENSGFAFCMSTSAAGGFYALVFNTGTLSLLKIDNQVVDGGFTTSATFDILDGETETATIVHNNATGLITVKDSGGATLIEVTDTTYLNQPHLGLYVSKVGTTTNGSGVAHVFSKAIDKV